MPAHPSTRYDVAIIGGGVIGLCVAYALSERKSDRRVVVIEAQTDSREASWAAAGMLAPYSECSADSPFFRLCRDSADLYPDFTATLRDETGLPCTLMDTGSLLLQLDGDSPETIDIKARFLQALGVEHAVLDGDALRRCEPGLGPAVARALRLPERSVNNRQLWDALAAACRRRGVELRPGTPVSGARYAEGRIELLDTATGPVEAETVVLAAGAWSQAVGDLLGVSLPVTPVKGQMLRFDAPDDTVRRTLQRSGLYVVPRPGFGIVVGTTVEECGFDHSVEAAAITRLAQDAAGFVPALAGRTPVETWAGLRPKMPDGTPVLGYAPGMTNLLLATGHFRNGILLTPLTGRIIADLIDGECARDLAPFAPDRFATV